MSMKVFIILLFVFTFPIDVFLGTLLYGGISAPLLKQSLLTSNVYEKMGNSLSQLHIDETDQNTQEFNTVIKMRFTPDYIRKKSEEAIDSSANWITNTTTTPPTISFKEVKQDIVTQYPNLLPSLEQMKNEVKTSQTPTPDDPQSQQQIEDMTKSFDKLSDMAKSDFTIKLDTYVAGVKQFYTVIKIATPILVILLCIYVLLLGMLAHTWPSRLTWIGSAFFVGGMWGFMVLLFLNFLVAGITTFIYAQTTEAIALFAPIPVELIQHIAKTYTNYQGISSITFFVIAACCFVAATVIKNPITSVPKKPQQKKR
jgi:hypothetical protein